MKKIIAISTIALGLLQLISCGGEKKVDEKEEIISVKVSNPSTVESLDENTFVVNGKLESAHSATISSKIMGKVIAANFREGQSVSQGQTMVQIKSDDLKAQQSQADGVIAEATAVYNSAETNYNRFKTLFENQSATKFEFDNAKMQYEMAKSRMTQAKSGKSQISSMASEANVSAPFGGTIISKNTEVGSLATPGAPLFTIEASGNLVLKALIPESEIKNVKIGQSVSISVQSETNNISGVISLINTSSQFTGSQYEVEIGLQGSPTVIKSLRSGMFANVVIHRMSPKICSTSEVVTSSITVPKTALVENGQLKGIYTISHDNRAILRWVRVGKDFGDKVEIVSGLNCTEKYILSADGKLYNGVKISTK